MKKLMRYLSILVSIVMAMSMLSGCGAAEEEPASLAPAVEAPEEAEDEEFVPAYLQDDPEPPVTEFAPSDTESADEEVSETEPATDNWEDDPSVIPEDQGPQPMGTAELAGKILVLNAYYDKNMAKVCNIYAIDPQSGSVAHVRNFVAPQSTTSEYNKVWLRPIGNFNFTEDYTKFAHTEVIPSNGSIHAGWVDCAGEFTDVNALVGDGPTGEFDAVVNFRAIGFTNAGRFVYQNIDTEEFFSVNPATYDDLQSYDLNYSDFTPKNQSFQDLGFANTERYVWSKFSSPDGSKLAFMSIPKMGETMASLYIMPTLGGDPVKLETGLTMECKIYSSGINPDQSNPEPILFPYIMDWR